MNIPKACVSCSQTCLIRHKKRTKDDPRTVGSFFKVMFGKNILHSLVLPPIISKMLGSSVEKRIVLEDSNRLKWDVLLTERKGCLAFRKGWDNFVLDHNIEIGDFVVFYFIKNEHLLVEIYGITGCPKVLNTDKNRTPDMSDSDTPSFIPNNRPAHKRARNEPFMDSRHVPTRGEFSEKAPWVEPCFMSRRDKHGPKVVPDDPIMTSREKARPKVAPVAETEVDPWFMTNRYKTRPKMVPDDVIMTDREKTRPKLVPEDPIMTNRDKTRPKVGPVAETEVDPWSVPNREDFGSHERTPWVDSCSMSHRDKRGPKMVPDEEIVTKRDNNEVDPCFMTRGGKSSAVNDDRDVLFDLSRFETPVKKSNIDKEEETDCGQDITIDSEDSADDLMDLPDWVAPKIDITNVRDEGQRDRKLLCQESEKDLHVGNEAFSTDVQNFPVSEENPDVKVPVDSILPSEVSQKLAQSGEKTQISNQKKNMGNQNFCGDAEAESSVCAKFSMGEQDLGDYGDSSVHLMNVVKGEKVQPSNQGMKACNQEIRGYSERSSYGEFGDSSSHLMNVKGGNMGNIKPELRDVKQNIYADPMADYVYGGNNFLFSAHAKISSGIKFGENFSPMMKTEVKANIIVKEEPEDYDASSPETVVAIKCSVLIDNEDFLLLPEPLNLAGGRNRYIKKRQQLQKQQLVLLRDHAGKLWPVLYNRGNGFHVLTSGWKSFMKAINIQPGDECIFTVTNGENILSIQVIRPF